MSSKNIPMMNNSHIYWKVHFDIHGDMISEFKKVVQELVDEVRNNEPFTQRYNWSILEDNSKCVAEDSFSDSKGALDHLNARSAQTIFPKLLEYCKLTRIEVFGNPSKELRDALASYSPLIYIYYAGFNR